MRGDVGRRDVAARQFEQRFLRRVGRQRAAQIGEMLVEIRALQRERAVAFLHQQAQVVRKGARGDDEPVGHAAADLQEMFAVARHDAAGKVDCDAMMQGREVDEAFMRFDQRDRANDGIGK
ncbi:hypothetical protein [Burkholderia ubonensis]|uniref:hypothetical protein n=1 Tax=Burkholderia ubonensis TaxID=101571 RepID=UPI001E654CF7|nr:hypothetical protein [Burkholderia ubonensis]